MGAVNNIESIKQEMSVTENKLADYILDHLEDIPVMTSSVLAERARVSPAAVIRFSKKIGFSKFSELKLSITKDLEKRVYNEYSDIKNTDSFQVAKTKLLRNDKMVIDAMGDMLDEKKINMAVDALKKVKRIYVFGVGTSALAAEDVKQKWTRLGKTVIFDKDRHLLAQQMQNDKGNCLFWGISHSGKNRDVIYLAEHAKTLGITTIGLSQLGQNNLSKKVDIAVQTARTQDLKNDDYGSGATHSIIMQTVAIDILFYFHMRIS